MCATNNAQILQDHPTFLVLSSLLKALRLVRAQISNLDLIWSHWELAMERVISTETPLVPVEIGH